MKFCFVDQATKLLGHTAEEMSHFKDMGDNDAYEAVFQKALFKTYIAKVTVIFKIHIFCKSSNSYLNTM
jgi:hypothetical protein